MGVRTELNCCRSIVSQGAERADVLSCEGRLHGGYEEASAADYGGAVDTGADRVGAVEDGLFVVGHGGGWGGSSAEGFGELARRGLGP